MRGLQHLQDHESCDCCSEMFKRVATYLLLPPSFILPPEQAAGKDHCNFLRAVPFGPALGAPGHNTRFSILCLILA